MAQVGVVSCPFGPRIFFFVGRNDDGRAPLQDLLPSINASAPSLISLFAAKTINANGLSALVGAHTASQQFFVDPSKAGDSQDSTRGIWDVSFYSEILSGVAKK
jgi:hypothetical protein